MAAICVCGGAYLSESLIRLSASWVLNYSGGGFKEVNC